MLGMCDVHGRDVEDDHQLGDENDSEEHATCLAAPGLGVVVPVPRAQVVARRGVSP